MKFLPQQPKYYKKTAALTDIIAVALIWAIAINPGSSILTIAMMVALNLWIWFSGPIFTKLGESIIKDRNEDKD